MNESTYIIINKVVDLLDIIGYTIKDQDNKLKFVNSLDVIRLARDSKIRNARAVMDIDTGQYILKVENGLENLNTVCKDTDSKLKITGRLMSDSGDCNGYTATDCDSNVLNLSINEAWELAVNNKIEDVEGIIYNGKKIIRGINNFTFANISKIKCS